MGKRTIAEVVESDGIAAALPAIGVDYAQGYGIAMPQPFDASAVLLGPRSAPATADTADPWADQARKLRRRRAKVSNPGFKAAAPAGRSGRRDSLSEPLPGSRTSSRRSMRRYSPDR